MKNTIHPDHLPPRGVSPWVGDSIVPFLTSYARLSQRSGARWPWIHRAEVESLRDDAWTMLGQWQARRAVIVSRTRFDRDVVAPVRRLARTLNEYEVGDLLELSTRPEATVRAVSRALIDAVEVISRIKPTRHPKPMFGSKVLHHYFPSVVPVFDTAKVRDGLMRSEVFRAFDDSPSSRWARLTRGVTQSEGELDEYTRYFAFVLAEVAEAAPRTLQRAREKLPVAILHVLPPEVVSAKDALLWRLDARVAELCACGATRK